ncbi:MAG: aldo/keto reductase [Peptococcaceae bacterium]|jgi:predicted aldo/keto reductase-like oxidoreductase|nr:aldo/keto reductase [Peptococcaceae bacterium]
MNYRTNPKTGKKHSLLGFGAMRLPKKADDPNAIDEAESIRIIRYAIDNGVNYIDTAYTYNEGDSEMTVAKALKDGYGDKVMIATKLPTMRLRKAEEHQEFLDTSLRRLERDSIDFYLLHGMKERYWETVQKLKTVDFLMKMKDEGKIQNFGLSFHGETFGLFKEMIDYAPWDFVQIQLNYLDAEYQAGVKGLQYAHSKGIAVIVMEPLRGGNLTRNIPPTVTQIYSQFDVERTPADWGLRWVANHPEVTTILSGMSTFEQVKEDVEILSDADAGCLGEKELSIMARIADEYRKLIPYPCTACGYCRNDCPQQIEIPLIIGMRNDASMFDSHQGTRYQISHMIRKPPSLCIECKKCEDICPQHLKVSKIMKECREMYEDESLQYWREYI